MRKSLRTAFFPGRKETAFFPGKFQPFHKGHLHAIKNAARCFNRVIIGVGTSSSSDIIFSFSQRKRMIEKVLRRRGLAGRVRVVQVPDVHNDEKWVENILGRLDFDVVVSGNPWVKRCFRGKRPVIPPSFLEKRRYNGTKVRKLLLAGKAWEQFVPLEIVADVKRGARKKK